MAVKSGVKPKAKVGKPDVRTFRLYAKSLGVADVDALTADQAATLKGLYLQQRELMGLAKPRPQTRSAPRTAPKRTPKEMPAVTGREDAALEVACCLGPDRGFEDYAESLGVKDVAELTPDQVGELQACYLQHRERLGVEA